MKKSVFFLVLNCFLLVGLFCQENIRNPLLISPEDLRLEKTDGGYNLFIKKLPGLESVMLTETTKDPDGKEDNYAYRATEYNSVNGDERRILDGEVLDAKSRGLYFLIDSSPQEDNVFGSAFLIYIPEVIVYGYDWSRNGRISIGRGTFVNIRGFSKKYCDYTGEYYDNPYMFNLERRTRPAAAEKVSAVKESAPEPESAPVAEPDSVPLVLTDEYNPEAAAKFKEFSDMVIYSKGPDTLLDDISSALKTISPKNTVDVVFAIDATGSMKDDIELLREKMIPHMTEELKSFGSVRFGLLLYRDYGDNFWTKGLPVKYFEFTENLNDFIKNLNSFKIIGTEGGDVPEAVYEALYASMTFYEWRPLAQKKIILIGDAEPHPTPRRSGKYSKSLVEQTANEKKISVTAIITPDDKGRRGR